MGRKRLFFEKAYCFFLKNQLATILVAENNLFLPSLRGPMAAKFSKLKLRVCSFKKLVTQC